MQIIAEHPDSEPAQAVAKGAKINQRAVIRDRIRILREHNFTGDELAEQDEDLKNEIWERAQQLKEENEKGSFTE